MKTISKRATKLIVEVTTRELYDAFHACSADIVWNEDKSDRELNNAKSRMLDGLDCILSEDPDNIRKLFREGDTYLLIPTVVDSLEKHDCIEIKVTRSDGKTFNVDNSDVQY